MTETIVSQARTLSSGTIASLTGIKEYMMIDLIQAAFVEFCESDASETWQEAWQAFTATFA